jgi:hypothetical protein
MKIKRVEIKGPDELDILSAIWILSCNDENPIITYEGIKHRLGLPVDYDVKSLVNSRGEMFRKYVTSRRLETWKQELRSGKHLPSWIRDIQDENKRKATIDALSPADVFRNQFRAGVGAPRSPIEIIDWGLQHIDRLRKASVEAREERAKRWSSMWIPILTTIVALTAVSSSAYLQIRSINTQRDLKQYEVGFKPKQEAYSSFMRALILAFDSALNRDHNALVTNLDKMESTYYGLQPFLNESTQATIWDQYQNFSSMCYGLAKESTNSPEARDNSIKLFTDYKKYFRTELYRALFNQ